MDDHSVFDKNELLIEQKSVRQHEGEPYRRIFFSKLVQMDIWYRNDSCNEILGTQITLDEKNVITALKGKPLSYTMSEENPNLNQSAILRSDGYADNKQIDKLLSHLLDQLPLKESLYIKTLIAEIAKGNYVNYPISMDSIE